MSAFHKALQGVDRETPNITFRIGCVANDDWASRRRIPGIQDRCHFRFVETDMEEPGFWTKFAFIKLARAKGWTWDEDGNWLCPECSEKGGEE